ncbi:MAG TPA: hypothetical protein VKY90_18595 [Candidatus Dormibacteraeota bacterium]|nr:hypothetical protein [Candidatus Dormibacteraeota bacterium]
MARVPTWAAQEGRAVGRIVTEGVEAALAARAMAALQHDDP